MAVDRLRNGMWELGPDSDEPEWRTVDDVPFEKTLFAVVSTAAGPFAIGDGGTMLADRGGGWEVIFDSGPHTRDNQLRALAVTDDGQRVWFSGSSGALGCYDVKSRRKFDYSMPKEMTSTWEAVTVAGPRGKEKALASNGSGEVLPFTLDGFDVDWGVASKPAGAGSTMAALGASPDGIGYAVDTSGNVFKTTADDGWERIGIRNAQVKFYDIYAGEKGRVYVAAGDGRIYRYDDSYKNWTPIGVTDTASLRAFSAYEDELVVLGNGGEIYERIEGDRWEAVHTPTQEDLFDVALGDPDVAVGADATVLERPRGQARQAGTSEDGDQFEGRGEYHDGDGVPPSGSQNAQRSGDGDGNAPTGDTTK
jgi:hypothetical protein